jgi:hypothetical protein
VGVSRYHLPNFGIAPEDTGFPILNTLGTQTDLIRSDILYYETYRGGQCSRLGVLIGIVRLGGVIMGIILRG